MKRHTPHFTFIKLRQKNSNTIKNRRLGTAAGACEVVASRDITNKKVPGGNFICCVCVSRCAYGYCYD